MIGNLLIITMYPCASCCVAQGEGQRGGVRSQENEHSEQHARAPIPAHIWVSVCAFILIVFIDLEFLPPYSWLVLENRLFSLLQN